MKPKTPKQKEEKPPETETDDHSAAKPALTVDYELYERYLENTDMSDDQKREFIDALWQIIVGFVDLGFGTHPAQQAQESCGKHPEDPAKSELTAPNEVNSSHRFLTDEFAPASGPADTGPAKGENCATNR